MGKLWNTHVGKSNTRKSDFRLESGAERRATEITVLKDPRRGLANTTEG